ncbi:hypothetical protein V6N13_080936 [Hibiscus sabdariffa]|uniref:Protein S-acyltransferase n=1 Tax=Hibiscus sabdariffa TaxID=183260 RepID=A0ABR2DBA3_9ROSI
MALNLVEILVQPFLMIMILQTVEKDAAVTDETLKGTSVGKPCLCEVEVFRYSKHCRVCDKCFDHHCRWLNNCIGQFFTLMVSALLLKQFSADISAKLGSSFSLVPFVIVVALCTILAMTSCAASLLPHSTCKKGDQHIIALREQEQEQQGVGEDVSKAAAEARKKSKILLPLVGLEADSSFGSSGRDLMATGDEHLPTGAQNEHFG